MADYRTEEEQVELLKKWWNENGKAIVLGVVIALAGYGGWMGWAGHQKSVMGSAADVYQQMIAAENAGEVAKVVEYGETLQKNYPNTVYGVFAALGLAKAAVVSNDLPRAAELLGWAQSQKPDDTLLPLVNLRLAQLQFAQGEMDKALITVSQIQKGEAWKTDANELRGDILLAQGKSAEAADSYSAALKGLNQSGGNQERRASLEMKLSNLGIPATDKAVISGDKL
jgi:predicted negative regulator of RcsB-dependent stress response